MASFVAVSLAVGLFLGTFSLVRPHAKKGGLRGSWKAARASLCSLPNLWSLASLACLALCVHSMGMLLAVPGGAAAVARRHAVAGGHRCAA